MKIRKSLSLFASFTVGIMAMDQSNMPPKEIQYIKALGKELKGNLVKYLKADPTGLQAAYFCAKSAETLTKKVNAKFPEGVKVRRTALHYRNPENKPDRIDIEVMKKMEAAIQEGNFKKKPVVIKLDGLKRVYVPLIAKKTCLKCHGPVEKINPQVHELIEKQYPGDQAVGFHEGDLRGVIVAEISEKKSQK